MCVYVYVCISMYVCACMYLCMFMCVCIRTRNCDTSDDKCGPEEGRFGFEIRSRSRRTRSLCSHSVGLLAQLQLWWSLHQKRRWQRRHVLKSAP